MVDITDIHGAAFNSDELAQLQQWNELLDNYAGRKLQPGDTVPTTLLRILYGMDQKIKQLEQDYDTLAERLDNFHHRTD